MAAVEPDPDVQGWLTFESLRWDGPPRQCPRCGAAGRCSFLPPRAGSRSTSTGSATARRVWRCAGCRQQFTVLTGTLLERTRVRPAVWLAIAAAPGARTPRAVARTHGVTAETARGVLARLACVSPDPAGMQVVRRLLRLPADEVARLRAGLPTRSLPTGPSADYR